MRSNTKAKAKEAMKAITIRLEQSEIAFLYSYACQIALPGEGPNLSRAARTIISTAKTAALTKCTMC